MRTRTQRWWLAGGLVLAFLSGGSALQASVRLAEAIQKPGHGLQAGFGISGNPLAGVIWGSNPIAGVVWGDQPVAVTHPHTPSADGYGLGGKTLAGFGISGTPVA